MYTKTVSEFSSSRKIRYGDGSRKNTPTDISNLRSAANTRLPLSYEDAIQQHTAKYEKDVNGNDIYVIEFQIGTFNFDELTIKTETNKLNVQGKSKIKEDNDDELSREFKREFKLPKEVDEKSIKAELDEKTRQLKLVGQVHHQEQATSSRVNAATQQQSFTSMSSDKFNAESYQSFNSQASSLSIGNVKEVKSTNLLEYEIYLGNELKDGEVIFEVPNKTTLNIRIVKVGSDANGDFNLELKREIRLPFGAKLNNIDHGVDSRTKTLIIKVPLE